MLLFLLSVGVSQSSGGGIDYGDKGKGYLVSWSSQGPSADGM